MKNIEVELRALLPDPDRFEEKLKQRGAAFSESSYLCDVYLCEKSVTKIEDAEMNEVGSYSIRLRKAESGGVEKLSLNTKTITRAGDHNAWEEHEIHISDFSEAGKILMLTEFRPFFKLEKNRRVYKYQDMDILIEEIMDFGGAVEIEIMANSGEEEACKQRIREFLHSVGITDKDIVPKSITNIVMKERAFKQDITF